MTLENGHFLKERYRILDILGQGGMGAVYRAIDENLEVEVAVKENSFFSEEHSRQFQKEAKILASLRHPNLPRVFDYFVIDRQGQYLVMDFIEGEDLRQWMSGGAEISEIEVIRIGISICDALIYLHSRVPPITHRDIKPGNIKITPDGEVLLVDFGLVKVMNDNEMTTTAARAMTPGYSPPEQYGDTPTDHRSDLFSLGSTLYAALAGYLPEDSLCRATGKARLTPLKSYNPQISQKTADVIEKALELRFEDRWQSAKAFKSALLDAYEEFPLSERSSLRLAPMAFGEVSTERGDEQRRNTQRLSKRDSTSSKRKRQGYDPVWILFDIAIIILSVLLATTVIWPEGLPKIIPWGGNGTPIANLGWLLNPQTTPVGVEQNFSTPSPITNDSTDVPLLTETIGSDAATLEPVEMTSTAGVGSVSPAILSTQTKSPIATFSPTPVPTFTGGGSGALAFVSERTGKPQIWLKDITTGDSTQLTDLNDGACQPDWSPDGKQIVFTSPCSSERTYYTGSNLFILNVDTESVKPLPASLEGNFDPAWSPDGEWIAYTSLVNGQSHVMKINLEDLSIFQLTDGTFDNYQPVWSDDGQQIVFVRNRGVEQIWLMASDGSDPVQFSYSGLIDNSNPAWYDEQNLILFSQDLVSGNPNKQLYGMRLIDIGKEEEYLIMSGTYQGYVALMDHVDVSPDGLWLVFDFWYYDVFSDIYMMRFPSSELQQLTADPGKDYDPSWRP
jgi:serine/threonine protein kinase/Tol biopolymer transport system component